MLTIKNRRTGHLTILFLALGIMALATGCKPAGPRALLAGKKLLEQGNYEAAVEQLKTAASLIGTNALAWNYLGLAQHAAGKASDAVVAYKQALALNPNLTEVHYNLGCLLLEQNNPAAAKAELTTYALSRPKEAHGWLKLGAVQLRLQDWANAERSYSEALRLNKLTPEAWNALGLIQLQRRNFKDAAKNFDAALRCQADFAPALLNLAIVQQQYLNNRPLALKYYRDYAALKTAPPNQEAVAALARTLDAELNPPVVVAKPSLPPVASLKPAAVVTNAPHPVAKPAAKTNLAAEAPAIAPTEPKKQGADVTAAADAAKTNSLPEATNAPALAVAQPGTNAVVAAAPKPRVFPRYAYHSPEKPKAGNRAEAEPAMEQGLLAQQRQRLPEALAAFESAVKADPSYFKARYNLAWTAYALKDLPAALEAYEYALVLDPESPNARYNFALTLKQAGYPLDAVNELAKLLAKKPDDTAAHLLTANLYAQQLGAIALARQHYLQVLKLEPQHPQATQIRYWLTDNP